MIRLMLGLTILAARLLPMLRTNAGTDHQAAVMATTATQPAPANYMALTANATAPAAGNTALAGEIATAGGGLVRKQAVYAHTPGTNTYTLTGTFTGTASDNYPVTIAKVGVFNAASGGTLVWETLLSPTAATLNASGDQLTVTQTVTL